MGVNQYELLNRDFWHVRGLHSISVAAKDTICNSGKSAPPSLILPARLLNSEQLSLRPFPAVDLIHTQFPLEILPTSLFRSLVLKISTASGSSASSRLFVFHRDWQFSMFHLRAVSKQPEFPAEKINAALNPIPQRKTLPKTQQESKLKYPGKIIPYKGQVKLFWKTTARGTMRTLISKAVIIFDPQKIGLSIPWVNWDNIKWGEAKKTLVFFWKRDVELQQSSSAKHTGNGEIKS